LKIFDLNWLDVFAYLDDWDQLEPTTQRTFDKLKPGQGVSPVRFGKDLDFLVERGFLVRFQEGSGRVKLDPRCHAFVRVIRSLLRNPILERPIAETLHDYLAEHFNADERSGLAGGGFGHQSMSTLLATLTADRHLLEFLEQGDAELPRLESLRLGEAAALRSGGPRRHPGSRAARPGGARADPAPSTRGAAPRGLASCPRLGALRRHTLRAGLPGDHAG
jgi:hypothetical protein